MTDQFSAETTNYLRAVTYTQIAVGFIVQAIALVLQIGAFRRHGNKSFKLLVLSTVCGVLFLVLTLAVYWIPPGPVPYLWLCSSSFVLFCIQGTLGLVGLLKLFRDYHELAAAAQARHTSNSSGADSLKT